MALPALPKTIILRNENAELAELAAELGERMRRGETINLTDRDGRFGQLHALLPTIQMMAKFPCSAAPTADLGILGDFRLLRVVGRGGMGVVYEAVQVSLDRKVALKVLPNAAVLDARQLRRFQVEAQAAASLHHPHIVPVFATGSAEGIPYYAMQFIEGCDLARVLRELRQDGDTDSPRATHYLNLELCARFDSGSHLRRRRRPHCPPGSAWRWNMLISTMYCIATSNHRTCSSM